jgi:hypothetical protein
MVIPGVKSQSPLPQHGAMPPSIELDGREVPMGVSHPLTKPPCHCLHVAVDGG